MQKGAELARPTFTRVKKCGLLHLNCQWQAKVETDIACYSVVAGIMLPGCILSLLHSWCRIMMIMQYRCAECSGPALAMPNVHQRYGCDTQTLLHVTQRLCISDSLQQLSHFSFCRRATANSRMCGASC